MDKKEYQAAFSLGSIFALRLIGSFMILPVFALLAKDLPGNTPALIGLALGIFGLTQALFQLPLGMLSDKFGRKPIILAGLIVFALGSLIAAQADSIYAMILGRALQGAGAIGSTVLATIADTTREQNRTKAMAIIGLMIGFSFSVAMLLGPLVAQWDGLSGLMTLACGFACLAIGVLYCFVPNPPQATFHRDAQLDVAQFKTVIRNSELLRLNAGIAILHAVFTANFLFIPVMLSEHLPSSQQWKIYLPVLLLALLCSLPGIIIGEKKQRLKEVLLYSILALALSQLLLIAGHSWGIFILAFFILFTAFNLLEAILPSMISKIAPAGSKGTATGVYSTCQFFGIFLGGFLGGKIYATFHNVGLLSLNCAALIGWWLIAYKMANPKKVSTYLLQVGQLSSAAIEKMQHDLLALSGVVEAVIIPNDGIAYLKVDKQELDETRLLAVSQGDTASE